MDKVHKLVFSASVFSLALLLTLSCSAYAASQSDFYGVWVRGNTYYEIKKDAITKFSLYDDSYEKEKYRIVKWEKFENILEKTDNRYTIYTLSEEDSKVSFEAKIDAYSDVSIDGREMKKSSAAELNKAIRSKTKIKKTKLDYALDEIANETNRELPVVISPELRMNKVKALPGEKFAYYYSFVDKATNEINIDISTAKANLVNAMRMTPEMKFFIDNKVTIIYVYKDKDGKEIASIEVTYDDYK